MLHKEFCIQVSSWASDINGRWPRRFLISDGDKVMVLGKILTDESVGVSVLSSFSGAVEMCEIDIGLELEC